MLRAKLVNAAGRASARRLLASLLCSAGNCLRESWPVSACVTIDDKTLADLSYFEPPRTGAPVADIQVLKETILVLRRFWILTLAAVLLAGAGFTPARGASAPQRKTARRRRLKKWPRTVVLVFGARERLVQIRRTGSSAAHHPYDRRRAHEEIAYET